MLNSGLDHLILQALASREAVVRGAAGLHARPAALFCRAAGRFRAGVRVEKAGHAADARSLFPLLPVLQLDVRQGDRIVLVAEGDGAGDAIEALARLLAGG